MRKSGLIFGGIFFLAGFGVFYFMVLSPLIDLWSMQSWQPVNGQLISSKISNHQSSGENGSSQTMYKVEARYNYQVAGSIYTGERVSIMDNASSGRARHYHLLSKLRQEQSRYRRITVWYDPQNPGESVYDRSLNSELLLSISLFTSIFMILGGTIIGFTWNDSKNYLKTKNSDAAKPWMTYCPWASSIVYSKAQSSVKVAWFSTVLITLSCLAFSLNLFGVNPVATTLSLLILIIPCLVGKWAIRIRREWNRFKKVPLKLNPYPGEIGGCCWKLSCSRTFTK